MSKRDKRRHEPRPPTVPRPSTAPPAQATMSAGAQSVALPGPAAASETTSSLDWRRWVLPVLAGLGILDSLYLSWVKIANAKPFCGNIGDCDAVNSSVYSAFMGIPIAFLGVAMYAVILGLALWGDRLPAGLDRYAPLAIFGISLGGVLYSAYLTYVELYVLEAICIYCVISAILISLIFLWSLWTLMRPPQPA